MLDASINDMNRKYILNPNEKLNIIDDAKVGIWKIEILKDNKPKLYGDLNMYRLLGVNEDLSPEELYEHWYSRIDEIHRNYIEETIKGIIISEKTDEVQYIWHHPSFNKVIIECSGSLIEKSKDRLVLSGIHVDVTDRLSDLNIKDDDITIVDYLKLSLCGRYLIRAFEYVFLVNSITKRINKIMYRHDHYQMINDDATIFEIIDECVHPDKRNELKAIFEDESISHIIENKIHKSVDFEIGYLCEKKEMVRGTLYPFMSNSNNELLFVIQNIENEYKLKEIQEEKEDVLYSITNDRSVIYEIDFEHDKFEVLKYDRQYFERSNAVLSMNLEELVNNLCNNVIEISEHNKAKEFLSYENIKACYEENKKKSISLFMNPNKIVYGWLKVILIPSTISKNKVYILIEYINNREQFYPFFETLIKDTIDYLFFFDLKNHYYFKYHGSDDTLKYLPEEGYLSRDYIKELIDKYVLENERNIAISFFDKKYINNSINSGYNNDLVLTIIKDNGEKKKKSFKYKQIDSLRGLLFLEIRDVTDSILKEIKIKKAQENSIIDELTQLYNRRGIEMYIKSALASNYNNSAFIILDLDNFKMVNDLFGHPKGDEILISAAKRMKDILRESDFVGRLGGDEFVIYLSKLMNVNDIHIVLDRLIKKINMIVEDDKNKVYVTPSIGVTIIKEDKSFDELYKEADIALYNAKKNKNCYTIYKEESGDING